MKVLPLGSVPLEAPKSVFYDYSLIVSQEFYLYTQLINYFKTF